MKKLYVLLLAVMLLTLAACLTACSAVPMLSLADDKLQPPDSPAKDTGEKADPLPQEWSIRLEQVNKENYAEDDRLLAKGSYQVFQLEPEDGGNTLTVTTQTADSINRYFEQWRKSQLQFLADVTERPEPPMPVPTARTPAGSRRSMCIPTQSPPTIGSVPGCCASACTTAPIPAARTPTPGGWR